ncbi:MAG: enoyl-CoA hydratase/isomerase family protein [Proteobacteria bacterium]|nr:enoyl-CoA hydratase/isomerase family protein [Pseudomonadota bacterium]
MKYKHLKVERKSHIAVVTLNRPEKLNALNSDLMKDIEKVTEEFQEDVETRVVIFHGAGQHFSAGADLSQTRHRPPTVLEKQRAVHLGPRMIRKLQEMNQITIAAVHGVALGGGACIAAALDFRIGADDCRIGYPEGALGICLSWVALPMCVHLVGPSRAKRMLILARKEKARTLLDWGYLDEIVSKEELMEKAFEMAREYAVMPPVAAQMIKRSVNAVTTALDQSVMHMDSDQLMLCHTTEDFGEAVTAFFEKREGTYKGN